MNEMKPETFWLVWSPRGKYQPMYRHKSFVSAATEAQRLAEKFPGRHFYVMVREAVRCVEKAESSTPAPEKNQERSV